MDIRYYNKFINQYSKKKFTDDAIEKLDEQVMKELYDILHHTTTTEKKKLLSDDTLEHIIYIKDGYTII